MSIYTNEPTSYVWVWKVNACGHIDPNVSDPICLKAGQEFADRMSDFSTPEFFIVDTLGQWSQVVERPFVGHETVSVQPPLWVESRKL